MKSAVAWNVKGVGYDARETAREAARRAGMSVGEWLNAVIIDSAGELSEPGESGRPQDLSDLHRELDQLGARLGKMGSAAGSSRDAGGNLRGLETWLSGLSKDLARCSEETPQRVAAAIGRLNERLDQLIDGGRNAASEFERRVKAVDHALDEINGETAPLAAGWPEAIGEIKGRQRALDAAAGERDQEPTAPPDRPGQAPGLRMSALDQQIRTLSRQLEMMRRPCGFDESVAALRHDLGHIGDALSKAMPRCALDALESEVYSLSDRVGRGRGHGDADALAGIEQRLGKLHASLTELTPAENVGALEGAVQALSRKIDALAAGGPDVAALQHLERTIGELRGLTERVASGEALAKLAKEVRTLSDRMDRFATVPGEAMSSLERRVESLSQLINARAAESGHAVPARLEALIGALNTQLERLDLGPGEQPALAAIEDQIAKLADKIDASDARLGNAELIERGLADVFLQIEEARANAVAAEEFKRDLADLRLSQSEADRRTQQTLEAVQDIVGRLADRLATMESGRRDEVPAVSLPSVPARAVEPVMPAPPAPLPTPPVVPAASIANPVPTPPVPERSAAPAAAQARPPIDPSLPGDHPLEPGSARGRPGTPAERIAASEAAIAPIKPHGTPEPSERANFIAAARRAAQAAAAEASQAGGKRAADTTGTSPMGDAAEKLGKFKRPLFMSVAAAVLILGAAHVSLSVLGSSSPARHEGRQAANDVVPAREPAKPARPVSAASTTSTTTAETAKPPVPDPQLLAPTPVGTASVGAQQGAPAAPASRQEPSAAPSQWGIAAIASPTKDITGSLTGPAPEPARPSAPPPLPSADSLPAAIGGPGLRAAAAAGDAAAAYEIAIRYAEGRGVAQSFAEAAAWFQRASDQGVAPAQYRLGSLYEKGHGVKKDVETARRLYIAAADKGNAKAMHNLAVLHAEGIDGKPDYKTAAQWFRKAATYGVADSQYNLGILYARGIGLEQNLAESYKWFALAAQQGDQDAGRKRDDVGARLDPQSLVAAKLAAQTFAVAPQPAEATGVKSPAGGWDRPAAAAPAATPAKQKAAPRRTGST
jgi:localization factor PodJL